ncbi:uncharacterized protein [Branchiostoma lanceolatum]|uniref:uncharacterized protein n=1 Tax=Branchiostoma lanceolatum TaxID=7740 RepID=UPI003452355F
MTETYCTLCQAPFSGAQAAKEHFAGKRHLKNLEKLRMMSPSTRDVLESKSLQSEQHEVKSFAKVNTNSVSTSFCDLCKAPFSSVEAAGQHYAGKRHKKMVDKQQIFSTIDNNVSKSVTRTATTQSTQLEGLNQLEQRSTSASDVILSSVSTQHDKTSVSKANTNTSEKTGPTTLRQQSLSTGAHGVNQNAVGGLSAHGVETYAVMGPSAHGVDPYAVGGPNAQGADAYAVAGPSTHGVDAYAVGGPSVHGVDAYAVGGPSAHGVDTRVIGGPSAHGVDPYVISGPSVHGVDPYAVGGPSAHGVDPYAVMGQSAHCVDPYAVGGPSAHGVDPYAVGGPNAQGADAYAVAGPSTHGVDAYAVGGPSAHGVDAYAVGGPGAQGVDAYAVGGLGAHGVDTQAICGPSAHGVDSYAIGGPSENGVDTYAVGGADDFGSSVLIQSVCEEDAYFCKICLMPLSGPVPAKQHYSGRTHRKRSQASHLAGVLEKSGQDCKTPDLESSRQQVEKTANGNTTVPSQDVQFKTTFCDLCNVPLSGPQPAVQHYAGRAHRRKVDLQRNELSPKIWLSRQPQPTDAPLSIFTTVLMCDGVQEETKKRHGEIKETDIFADKTLMSSAIVEGKFALVAKQFSNTEINQSERRSASEGQVDQSDRSSAPGGQMDKSEGRSASGGQMDQSEWRSASQDQPSSLIVTSSPMVSLQTSAPSEAPFVRSECQVYSRSVSTPAASTPGHKLQPRRMLSTSRLACNFQTQMAPPNTLVETRNHSGTLRAGYTATNGALNSKLSSPTVSEENVAQSITVSPFVSEQPTVPVQGLLVVKDDNPCEKTLLKTPNNTEDVNVLETIRPGISAMLTHETANLEGDTTIDNQRFEYQRPQEGNTAIVSGTF